MDCPPEHEDVRPWLYIGVRLKAAGLHVPEVYAQDLDQGFLLIEDMGTQLYLDVLDESHANTLYSAAMDALLLMQTRVNSEDLPMFNHDVMMNGLLIMPRWFLGHYLEHTPDDNEWVLIKKAFAFIVGNVLAQPLCFVHRDFHSRNLMLVSHRTPGILDFQGALNGPITYDLASLLRDAYISWPDARVQGWVRSYWQMLCDNGLIDDEVDCACFQRWFDLTGLQRHLRLLGQFVRLERRDGKKGYLKDLPRIYQYVLEVARSYPELNSLADLLKYHAADHAVTQAPPAG